MTFLLGIAGGEIVFVALIDLCSFVPTLLRVFLLKNIDACHNDAVSDIPGNPHAFSPAIISLFRTLPEPSNFNIIWTGLSLSEPLLLRGTIPFCRFSSLSVYGAGGSDPPNSVELNWSTENNDRSCEVIIASSSSSVSSGVVAKNGTPVVSCEGWKKGFIAMRNYLVPPGTRVQTPEIVRLKDGAVIRPHNVLVSGPCELDMRFSRWALSAGKVLLVNTALVFANHVFLDIDANWNTAIVVFGVVLGYSLYCLCFVIGGVRLRQLTKDVCKTENVMYFCSLEAGAKTSQPSKLHKYWLMNYHVPIAGELCIRIRIKPSLQKYWSVVVYDTYGLPLPQYVFDENAVRIPLSEASQSREGVYDVDIRLVNDPVLLAHSKRDHATTVNFTVVDISSVPQGYVLFRVNHPKDESVIQFSSPETELIISNAFDKKSI